MSLRTDFDHIIRAALQAVDPARAVQRHVTRTGDILRAGNWICELRDVDEIVLVAVGKAAFSMAEAAIPLIVDKIGRGLLVTKYGHAPAAPLLPQSVLLIESGHPIPDENSLRAGRAVCDAVSHMSERSLVLACISGGASALMAAPLDGISLSTLRAVNDALLRSGADIREMNVVRAAIDRLKGGGLARMAAPARILGLILSDVNGDPLDVIASGLTNDPRATNVLVANNAQACEAAAESARALGYVARIVTTSLSGEARERGREIARAIAASGPKRALIFGGETTVTLRGAGTGGRNQELALAAAMELDGSENIGVASLGTDGSDGPTDAAGATAFGDTIARATAHGRDARDFLNRNDSYHFFDALGDLIKTGPTGTNVADVVIALRG